METAVKMQNTSSVKATASGRLPSAGASAKDNGFSQLLQVKKDAADVKGQSQAEKPGTDKAVQTDKKTPGKEAAEKTSQNKKEDAKVSEEPTNPAEGEQQEALLRAAMEQAAAQMAGMFQEEAAAEVLEPVMGEIQGEIVAAGEQPAGERLAEAMTPENLEPVQKDGAETLMARTPKTGKEPVKQEQPKTEIMSRVQQSAAENKSPEVRPDTRGQQDLSGSNDKKPRQTEDGSTQQMAGAGTFRISGQQEHLFHETGRTEQIPLKTTPDTLPEDLGKALAAKLPDTGKTLTVELEPASLGKLTIRLTYEAGRAAVSILATNPKTLELLSTKAAEIASILEEKTGEETVIFTQEPHEQEQYQENKNNSSQQQDQGQGQQRKEEQARHSDSFAQQLRLGLA